MSGRAITVKKLKASSSPQLRAAAKADLETLREEYKAAEKAYADALRADPVLVALRERIKAARKLRDEASWRATYHQFRAVEAPHVVGGFAFQSVLGEGDTAAEARERAEKRQARDRS